MGSLAVTYYPSGILDLPGKNAPIFPCIELLNLSGFSRDDFKIIKGQHCSLACYGELRISYCITKNIPYLKSSFVTSWSESKISFDAKNFDECIQLPLSYDSLYDYNGVCFILTSTYTDNNGVHEQLLAGANMKLYNSKKLFRHGLYEIELHPLEPLGIRRLEDVEKIVRETHFDAKPKNMDQMNQILKTNRKHLRDELFKTPLDIFTRADAERTIDEDKRNSGRLFLCVNFKFSRDYIDVNIPVVLQRRECEPVQLDSRVEQWNPVEEKYFRMTRTARTAEVDRARKPNKETLDRLKDILDQPPGRHLWEADRDLVWQYRFHLASKFPEVSLPKFLLAVPWKYPEQVNLAIELLHEWPTVAPEHVLELLDRQFEHPVVRRFAVARLQDARDEELLLYLYQLVQALRQELQPINPCTGHSRDSNFTLLNAQMAELNLNNSSETPGATPEPMRPETTSSYRLSQINDENDRRLEMYLCEWKEDLPSFLIRRALMDFRITNYLYWFVRLECDEDAPSAPDTRAMYSQFRKRLLTALLDGTEVQKSWHAEIMRQDEFVHSLCRLLQSVSKDSKNRTDKIELLRTKLVSEEYAFLSHFAEPLALPLDPRVRVCGIDASSATFFKSAQQPALLSFLLPDGGFYEVIFKRGDDLRRDQLVLQMIELMDSILRKENFDLKLTPYKVLATNNCHGFVQFIRSTPLSVIKNDVLGFLRKNAPSTTEPLRVQKDVMETYIRSCAGYCVITYLLGVGDRHLDNLLLTANGHLFHIDFSFIFGNDSKPLMAGEVRLTLSMIEAMGGPNTQQFKEFWKITFTAFCILRRHANLFLTLFSLISNTGIEGTVRGQGTACDFLRERFCTNQTEEIAVNRLANRMIEATKAVVPDIMERMHSFLQYLRA